LTGDPNFVASNPLRKKRLHNAIKDFNAQTKDEPEQRASAQILSTQIDQYLDEFVRPVLGIAKYNLGAAKAAAQEEGTLRTDQIRQGFAHLREHEHGTR